MITNESVSRFLAGHRIAVAGASDTKGSFGRTICRELASRGYDPVPVHPRLTTLDGRACFPAVPAIPGRVDGVIVMVSGDAAVQVVDGAASVGVDQIWLFKGV